MPLVKRKIQPVYISRRPSTCGLSNDSEYDWDSVCNVTLCGALKQLGSLLKAAEEIKNDLEDELHKLYGRTKNLTTRFVVLEAEVLAHNPRKVRVPELDLQTFSKRTTNFESRNEPCQMVFTVQTRPVEIQRLYEEAALTPVHSIREIDKLRRDGARSSKYFVCEPVIGDSLKKAKLKKLNLDIETRRPASFVVLRDWGSDDETFHSEVELAPVSPAVPLRPPPAPHPTDFKLPLPEQRTLALSYKYPPKLIPIDVSGRGFRRMELFRQSLIQFEYVKGKRRRRRVKRRNTIADAREIRTALKHKNLPSTSSGHVRSSSRSGSPSSRGAASSYTDRSFDTTIDTSSTKTSNDRELLHHHHLLGLDVSLPNPPKSTYILSRLLATTANTFRDEMMNTTGAPMLDESLEHSSPKESKKKSRKKSLNVSYDLMTDQVPPGTRDVRPKSLLPISTISAPMSIAVKLRKEDFREEGTRSSSGNWSGSSSTRTSLESDIQQSIQPQAPLATSEVFPTDDLPDDKQFVPEDTKEKKTLLSSVQSPTESFDQDSFISDSFAVQSSSPSSNVRTNSQATDEFPSSLASDGTVTPPVQDIQDIPFFDDDSSSAFSCDTEGYYTSFHIDSGIRSVSCSKLASESELVSTGTNSSAASLGTVIMRNPEKKTPPKPPQRVSSLERKENRESIITVIHINGSTSSREDISGAQSSSASGANDGRDSRSSKECDSGRDTASSPTESMSPRQPAVDDTQNDSLRQKTAINAIPSMCVITPPQSDDERSSRELSGVQRKIQSFQATLNATGKTPPALPVRQPGDGAVAPSTSPSQLQGSQAPSLTVMSQKRVEKEKNFTPAPVNPVPQKTVEDHLSLAQTVSVSERRAKIQLKVLGDKKPSSEIILQKQNSKDNIATQETSNIVSYKELPVSSGTASTNPFSAVPSNVKQNAVITPTNSLERRKVKGGAHVTLDAEGKVVYSSDSLPRRKSHSSFEPGPYIKPPPISTNGTQGKPKTSIQNMPLPPVPPVRESVLSSAATHHKNTSTAEVALSVQTTPQQPKLGTRSQGAPNPVSQTLSGLSAHIQPRTISQINSLRSKSPMATSLDKNEDKPIAQVPHKSKSLDTQDNIGIPLKHHKVLSKDQTDNRSATLPHKRQTTLGQESNEKPHEARSKEYSNYHSLQRQAPSHQKSSSPTVLHQQQQNLQYQQALQHQQAIQQKNLQHQQAIQQQALEHQQRIQQQTSLQQQQMKLQQEHQLKLQQEQLKLQQEHQIKLQQDQQMKLQQEHQLKLQQEQQQLKMQQENQQLKQQQEQQLKMQQQEQKLLQQQQKQQILQQQHMQLQQQLQQQQAQLQQHKALKEQAKKEAQASQMDSIYQTRQDLQRQQLMQLQQQQMQAYQQPLYPTQEELYMARQQMLQQQQRSQMGPTEVIMGTQGTSSPNQQLSSYGTTPPTEPPMDPSYPGRPLSATGYHVGTTTSRAPTPIQGLSTSSPQRLQHHQNLRTHQGLVNQRGHPVSGVADGRGTPIPGTMTPANYDQYNLTNSDIYGRIGMTRQVQVGGTLPSGFGRNQRNYSSLPPNLRQPMTPSEVLAHQGQAQLRVQSGSKTLTRRASVAGTESNKMTAASNPSTPEKALDKKIKTKKKKKEEVKPEAKKEKKKWFWTLPMRRKKKNKDENSEDDDGGFKDAEQKSVRKNAAPDDTSFIRYPSPDTGSSEMNSSYSSDLSSGDHGYRSSPSSEVYYYSQRAQQQQQQQQHQQQQIVQMRPGAMSAGLPTTTTPVPTNVVQVPRSQPTTPVSPPESLLSVDGNDITDLTQRRRYMSRDEMYAAMRHPQYYNNRNSIPGMEFSQNSTPTSSRSNSPAVFGVNPVPPYVVRPQVREGFSLWSGGDSNSQSKASQPNGNEQQTSAPPSRATDKEDLAKMEQHNSDYSKEGSLPPCSSPTDDDSSSEASAQAKVVAKQTTLNDFKKMILDKSMRSAGGKERISAVEMLRASRPSIYGFSPPPPVVVKEQAPLNPKGEGIIMPPSSRNTARALLFQSRFGSGRRFRAHKTEIISTTIIEDHHEDEMARLQQIQEDEYESEEEDLSSSTSSSQEKRSVYATEGQKTPNGLAPKSNGVHRESGVATSTPNKPNHPLPQDPNVSIIVADGPQNPSKDSQETAL